MHAADPSTLPAQLGKDEVRSTYERIAPVYDLWAMLTESRARRRCIETAGIRDGESVLEVAVGTGLTFAEVLRANPSGRNEGVDLTAGMLRRAESRARKLASSRLVAITSTWETPTRSSSLMPRSMSSSTTSCSICCPRRTSASSSPSFAECSARTVGSSS